MPETIAATFRHFQTSMRVLAGWRSCECELVGLDRGMELVADAMQSALPLLSHDIDRSKLGELERHRIALAYYAIVMVAMIVTREVGMALECPDKLRAGCDSAIAMLESLVPYVGDAERAWHDEILLGPSDAYGPNNEAHPN